MRSRFPKFFIKTAVPSAVAWERIPTTAPGSSRFSIRRLPAPVPTFQASTPYLVRRRVRSPGWRSFQAGRLGARGQSEQSRRRSTRLGDQVGARAQGWAPHARSPARSLTGKGAPGRRPAPLVGRRGAPTRGAHSSSACGVGWAPLGRSGSQPRGAPVGLSQQRRDRPLGDSL